MQKIIFLLLMSMLSVSLALGEVPGDLNGDDIISEDELLSLETLHKEGKITSEQLDEIYHINESYPRTIVDNSGKTVTIKSPIQKIIMLNADCAEVIRCLGVVDKIIGVDSYIAEDSIFFPELSKLPAVGSSFHPDCEMILTMDPDIVIAYTGVKEEELDDKIAAAGIPVARFSACKVSTRDDQLKDLGYLFEREENATELISFYHEITDPIVDALAGLTEAEKPKVYIECYSENKARNKNSGTDPMCEIAGGINIAESLDVIGEGTTTQIDPEWVIEENPDVIIKVVSGSDVSSGYDEDDPLQLASVRDSIMSRPGFDKINAVTDGRVYLIVSDICDRSCNAIGIAYLAKWFHPDLFVDMDPKVIHQEYLERFQGLDFDLNEHGVFVYPALEDSLL